MKAIDLAKQLYPALGKKDFIAMTCPDNLHIVDKIDCKKDKTTVDNECINCWNVEVSQARIDWLVECRKMCDLMCD